MTEAAQRETVAFLSDAKTHGGAEVETITTHASIVFMTGERVFKLKRAVKYSYLDFSTVDLRRRSCETELALNRRTAPLLYLGVQPVTRGADGHLAIGGQGEAVDWLVVMRRFPQEALFSHLAETGGLAPEIMRDLADRIAAFHQAAEVTPRLGGVVGVQQVIDINDENLRRAGPPGISLDEAKYLADSCRVFLARNAALLEWRRSAGKVRRCHGDLHLGNLCLIDGMPTLFDCLEFNESLASIDVLYDLAFLLMDLRHRGHATAAAIVFNRYLDITEESDGLAAMPLFLALRAWVRAHVAATAAMQGESEGQESERKSARGYFDDACAFLEPPRPRLVAIGGLSGTGKSTIAAMLAGHIGHAPAARILRSDVIRKRQHGVAPEQRLPPDAYSEAATRRVYSAVLSAAEAAVAVGCSVILDTVAAQPEERTRFASFANRIGVPFTGLWLEAAPDVLRQRVAARRNDASDADLAVLERQLGYDLGAIDWHRVHASAAPAVVAEAALQAIS